MGVLQWVREQGCPLGARTCAAAAGNGHLVALRWARHHGCAWRSSTFVAAAREGHLAVLQYAHQNGCEWSPKVCSAAARHGNLNIVKWLRQHGCPWDHRTSYHAAVNNNINSCVGLVNSNLPALCGPAKSAMTCPCTCCLMIWIPVCLCNLASMHPAWGAPTCGRVVPEKACCLSVDCLFKQDTIATLRAVTLRTEAVLRTLQ